MLLFFPIFIWTDYSNITMVKMITYLTSLASFVVMLFLSLGWDVIDRHKKAKNGEELPPLSQPIFQKSWDYAPDAFLLLFLFSATISWLLSEQKGTLNRDGVDTVLFGAGRYDGLLFLASYGLIFLLVSRYGTFQPFHLKGVCVVLLTMCVFAVIQLSGVNLFHFYPVRSYPGWHNYFVSTIGNVDMMGGFLCMIVPLVGVGYVVYRLDAVFSGLFLVCHTVAIYTMLSIGVDLAIVGLIALIVLIMPLLVQNRRYVCKMLDIAMTIVIGYGFSSIVDYTFFKSKKMTVTVVEWTTGATLAVMVLVVLAVLRYLLSKQYFENISWQKVRRGVVFTEISAFVLAFIFFRFIYQPTKSVGLMHDLYELSRFKLSLNAGHNRGAIWRYSLEMAQDHLWFGTGSGTFAITFKEYAKEVGYSKYANRHLDFAHNEYIHYLCTVGLSGLLCYLGFLGTLAWRSLKQIKNNPRILVLGAAVLGYCVQIFFSFSVVIVAPMFWVLAGLLMKEVRDTVEMTKQEMEEESTPHTDAFSEVAENEVAQEVNEEVSLPTEEQPQE
jgi:O-antigen ligase